VESAEGATVLGDERVGPGILARLLARRPLEHGRQELAVAAVVALDDEIAAGRAHRPRHARTMAGEVVQPLELGRELGGAPAMTVTDPQDVTAAGALELVDEALEPGERSEILRSDAEPMGEARQHRIAEPLLDLGLHAPPARS